MISNSRALPLALFLFTACASHPSTPKSARIAPEPLASPVLRAAAPEEAVPQSQSQPPSSAQPSAATRAPAPVEERRPRLIDP